MINITQKRRLGFIVIALASMAIILLVYIVHKKENKMVSEEDHLSELLVMAKTNEVFVETGKAGLILKKLHESGNLPGDSPDQHGDVTVDHFDLMVSNKFLSMTFPVKCTFHLVHTGETNTNNYTLNKQSSESQWTLVEAWQTRFKWPNHSTVACSMKNMFKFCFCLICSLLISGCASTTNENAKMRRQYDFPYEFGKSVYDTYWIDPYGNPRSH